MVAKADGLRHIAKGLTRTVSKNSPTILIAMGVVGVAATMVLAVKATPKALRILDQYERESLKPLDYVKLTWKEWVPPVLMGVSSIICFIGANNIHLQRTAALQGIYSLTDVAFKEYQAKVVETLGKNKEEKVREDILQDKLDKNPVSSNTVYFTGTGNSLCYDALSGRYFKSDIEKIRRIENEVNHNLLTDMWISLNQLYNEMGLEGIDLGERLGWDVDQLVEFIFSSKLTDTGKPCLVLSHRVMPVPEANIGYG